MRYAINVNFMVNMSNRNCFSQWNSLGWSFPRLGSIFHKMLDEDGDGIYEVALELNIGSYQYKFVNGNDWSGTDNDNGLYQQSVIFQEIEKLH